MKYLLITLVALSIIGLGGCKSCKTEEDKPAQIDQSKTCQVQMPPELLSNYPQFVTDGLPDQTPKIWRQWIVGKWRAEMPPHFMEFRFMPGGTMISKHIIQGQKPIIGRGKYTLNDSMEILYHIYGLQPVLSPIVMGTENDMMFVICEDARPGAERLEFVVQATRIEETDDE